MRESWYVHGPDLCYQVNDDASTTCFHADAMANIIALTESNTNLVAQYAYTPYGRTLGSTNLQSQISNPYLFVGSQGVMEELPGLYFMRARYYSADAGVFLSTDPIRKIGPGWTPLAYDYANVNPMRCSDPAGTFAGEITLGFALFNVIIEEAKIDYDVLVRGKSVSWRELGGRLTEAAVTGAAQGATVEFAPVFAGPWGAAGKIGAKSIANFGGKALNTYISGQGTLKDAAIDTVIGTGIDLGLGVLGGKVGGRTPIKLDSALFGKHGEADFVKETVSSTLIGAAKEIGQTLGSINAYNQASRVNAVQTPPTSSPAGNSGSNNPISNPNRIVPGTTITIAKGATLSGLAKQYGTTVSKLASLNKISNPNVIRAGATLIIR